MTIFFQIAILVWKIDFVQVLIFFLITSFDLRCTLALLARLVLIPLMVALYMGHQACSLSKCFKTEVTLIRLFTSVQSFMVYQSFPLPKSLPTKPTNFWSFICVCPQMF